MMESRIQPRPKLPSDTTCLQAEKPAEAAPKGKVRLLTLDDLDGRTRAAQQVRETRQAIMADCGGEDALSTLERIAVDNVALLDALTKDAAARWLSGQEIDVAAIGTLMNSYNRTAAVLGWKRRPRDITTLGSILRAGAAHG